MLDGTWTEERTNKLLHFLNNIVKNGQFTLQFLDSSKEQKDTQVLILPMLRTFAETTEADVKQLCSIGGVHIGGVARPL